MNRICEELKHQVVLPPSAVTTATLTTTAFVDCSNVPEVEFLVSTGALASGKKLTVGIYTSAVAAGTSAVKVSEVVFTADGALNSALVAASRKQRRTAGRSTTCASTPWCWTPMTAGIRPSPAPSWPAIQPLAGCWYSCRSQNRRCNVPESGT